MNREQVWVSRRAHLWPVLFLAAVLFFVAYWPALLTTVRIWNSDPDYSHGYLIVPLAVGLLWKRRARLPGQGCTRFDIRGLTLIVAAGVIRIAAARFYLPELDIWSIPVWLGGVVWTLLGWKSFAVAAPCLAFLWFAAPLPATLDLMLSAPLQQFAATAAAACLVMLGQPAVVEGTTVLLGGHILDVEQACSGLRLFYGVAALSVAYVMLTTPGRWRSCMLLLSTVPIAILVNLVRIVVTGLLLQYISNSAAQSFAHDFAGVVMIPVAVLIFFLVLASTNRATRAFAHNRQRAVSVFSLITLLLVIASSLILVWHHRQQRQAFTTLLVAANRCVEKEQWERAVTLLRRYVAARPHDATALVKLAEAVKRTAVPRVANAQLVRIYQRAWKLQPGDIELGRQYATALMQVGDDRTALQVLEQLRGQLREGDAALQRFCLEARARSLYACLSPGEPLAGYSWSDAAEALQEAMAYDDYDRRFALHLAIVQREHLRHLPPAERRASADDTIANLVADHATDPHAWLTRYEYAQRYWRTADPAAMDASLDRALTLARQRPGAECAAVFCAAARAKYAFGDIDAAHKLLGEAILVSLGDLRGYAVLAEVLNADREGLWWDRALQAFDDADDYLRYSLAEGQQPVDVPDWEKAWFMAQYYRATGQVSLTHKSLLDAWELSAHGAPPADRFSIAISAAQQFVGWTPKFAEACVRQALAINADVDTARYMLAELIIDYGDKAKRLDEAAALLGGEEMLTGDGLSDRLRRLWARLLSARNSSGDLDTAIGLLRGLAAAAAGDNVSLAELYERRGRNGEAWKLLREQADTHVGNDGVLLAAIAFWQRNFLSGGEKQEDADQLYEKLWNIPGGEMEVIRWKLCEVGSANASPEQLLAHVQPWLQRYWSSVPTDVRQESFAATLTILVGEKAVATAVLFCEKPPAWMPQREAWRQLLVVLPPAVGNTSLPAQAAERIDRYLAEHPDDISLELALADYHFLTGGYQAAAAHYVSALSRDPRNLHALNNYSLALCGGVADFGHALQLIDQALQVAPQDAGLLDTKALILVRSGRLAEADQLLAQLADREPLDPLVWLHAAVCAGQQERQHEARIFLLKAMLFGIEAQTLSLYEASALAALRRTYDI